MFSEALTNGTAWKMFGWLQDELIKATTCFYILFAILGVSIVLTIIIFIRQQKILRKLDEIAKKTEEPTTEDKP